MGEPRKLCVDHPEDDLSYAECWACVVARARERCIERGEGWRYGVGRRARSAPEDGQLTDSLAEPSVLSKAGAPIGPFGGEFGAKEEGTAPACDP